MALSINELLPATQDTIEVKGSNKIVAPKWWNELSNTQKAGLITAIMAGITTTLGIASHYSSSDDLLVATIITGAVAALALMVAIACQMSASATPAQGMHEFAVITDEDVARLETKLKAGRC